MAQKKRLNKILNHLDNPTPGFLQIVGNTPLIYLSSASKEAGTNIYGKCEFLNGAGGSIKDRAALWMILTAEKNGDLVRGEPGIIIEGTGGNTGIGLAVIGKALGYQVIIIIPNTQSIEKKNILKQCGAHLIEVEPNPYSSPNHYVRFTERFANNLKAEYMKNEKSRNIKILLKPWCHKSALIIQEQSHKGQMQLSQCLAQTLAKNFTKLTP